MADRLKLAAGLRNLPASAREDLAGREQDIQRGKTVELLRRAGKEMYENPIVNTAIGFTPVLGDVQAAGETMAALNRGAPWQETAGYAVGMLPFIPMVGKTVWHGSPHTFDKFDLSKIGTGEGAQAYGHGLYLAEARPTAEGYRDALATEIRVGDKPLLKANKTYPTGVEVLDTDLIASHGNFREASKNLLDSIDELRAIDPNHPEIKTYQSMLADLRKYRPETTVENTGSLYKVDLPDEQIAKMLDWDKPFSEQPQNVQDAITKYWQENRVYGDPTKLTGEGIYGSVQGHVLGNRGSDIANRSASQEAASMDLNYVGIPGIQYLDQASRGAGEGTRNYVVFSDEIPQILERNGQPVAQALRNYEVPQKQIANIPLSEIEHGESAMPGGKLSFPESRSLIKEYAEMPTEIPPIQVMAPDEAGGKWMIYDGSHRYEAAKLRGMNEIPVELENIDDIEAARKAGYLK